MKKPQAVKRTESIDFPRADPTALGRFDPGSKVCTMNCGPHAQDPRSDVERKFLCDECISTQHVLAPQDGIAR